MIESASTTRLPNPALVLESPRKDGGSPTSDRTWSIDSSDSLSDLEESFPALHEDSTVLEATAVKHGTRQVVVEAACKVRWGQVNIRLFPIIPGNHPDCLRGPPITIDWDHIQEITSSVDEFEEERVPDRYHDEQLRLSWIDRRCKLIRLGFTDHDLKRAADQSYKARRRRERSSRKMANESFEKMKESFFQKMGLGCHPKKQLSTRY